MTERRVSLDFSSVISILLHPPYRVFADLDQVDQRDLGGADVFAASAFHAVHNVVFLQLGGFHDQLCEVQGLELHGTYIHAAAALDALLGLGLVMVDGDDAVGALHNGSVQILLDKAHHGTAGLDGHIGSGDAAARSHQLRSGGTHLDDEVAGVGDVLAGDGGHTLDQGHAGLNGIGDSLHGGNVADAGTDISRQLAAGNAAAHGPLDEHLFAALGVLGSHFQDFHALDAGNLFTEQRDGIGLVLFDDDDALGSSNGLHNSLQTEDDLVGILQQHAVVGGEHGFTLTCVDQNSVDGLAGIQLDIGGEACAAHAHDTGILDDVDDLGGGQLLQRLIGLDRLVEGIQAVVFDDNAQALAAGSVGTLLDGDDLTADGGVNGSGDEASLLADLLAHLDLVANSHADIGGSAQMHGHGDDGGLGSA